VLDTDTLPVEVVQVVPRPPLVLVVLEELLEEELLELEELLLEEELLELDEELLELLVEPPVVVGAYEHHAEVTPEYAPPKFELEQATPLVKVPYTKLPDLPSATWRVPLKEQVAPVFCAHLV
jgi:hypothetical protein